LSRSFLVQGAFTHNFERIVVLCQLTIGRYLGLHIRIQNWFEGTKSIDRFDRSTVARCWLNQSHLEDLEDL
jgi:hypothetical protein